MMIQFCSMDIQKVCEYCFSLFMAPRNRYRFCSNRCSALARPKISPENRFDQKVDRSPGHGPWGNCHLWTGTLNDAGYGILGINGKGKRAHILAYESAHGPVPNGLELDHLCRVRRCVNPEHLEAVTHQVNLQRGIAGILGRERNIAKTHCPYGHPYSEANTYFHNNARHCRTCRADADKARELKRKQAALLSTICTSSNSSGRCVVQVRP